MTNLVIGVHGKKGTKLKDVKDFLFDWDASKPKGTQSPEEMKRIFESMAVSKEKERKIDNKHKPKSLQK